jgi:hypothetical protein
MMRFELTCKWNDAIVLEAKCTGVMAWEIIRGFAGNFSNPEKAGFEIPNLQNIDMAPGGWAFNGYGKDDAGIASYHLKCTKSK